VYLRFASHLPKWSEEWRSILQNLRIGRRWSDQNIFLTIVWNLIVILNYFENYNFLFTFQWKNYERIVRCDETFRWVLNGRWDERWSSRSRYQWKKRLEKVKCLFHRGGKSDRGDQEMIAWPNIFWNLIGRSSENSFRFRPIIVTNIDRCIGLSSLIDNTAHHLPG
jgi:hypothetical protein